MAVATAAVTEHKPLDYKSDASRSGVRGAATSAS